MPVTLHLCTINFLNSVTTHPREGKKVRILSQLRESDLPAGDSSRTLPSSSGLLEVLPIYPLLVDYIGSKITREYVASVTYEHCPCSVERMDAASIVRGNEWERFHECWHERFKIYIVIFCRYANRDHVT